MGHPVKYYVNIICRIIPGGEIFSGFTIDHDMTIAELYAEHCHGFDGELYINGVKAIDNDMIQPLSACCDMNNHILLSYSRERWFYNTVECVIERGFCKLKSSSFYHYYTKNDRIGSNKYDASLSREYAHLNDNGICEYVVYMPELEVCVAITKDEFENQFDIYESN